MVVCHFFLQGRCIQGEICRFEHTEPPLATNTWRDTTLASSSAQSSGVLSRRTQSTCAFFRRGTCRYGDKCKQRHDLDEGVAIYPLAAADTRSNVVCTFFLRNACLKGEDCPFSHAVGTTSAALATNQPSTPIPGHQNQQLQTKTLIETKTVLPDQTSASRTIAGGLITFANGAAVSKIALPADFSTISISNVPAVASQEDVRNVLKIWVLHEEIEIVIWKIDPQTSVRSAEIKVADGGRLCRDKISEKPKLNLHGADLQIIPVHITTTEPGSNRLQLAGLTCTWHNPSKTADLKYHNKNRAEKALVALQKTTREIHGRQLTFAHAQHSSKTTYHRWSGGRAPETVHAVHVGNLDSETSVDDLRELLNHHAPTNIKLGPSSHRMSKDDLERRVKHSLENHGNLLEWLVLPQPGVAKVKAYAKFASFDEAAHATKNLDNSYIDPASKDILHVQHVISVKLPVSQRILAAIKPRLEILAQTSQASNHVSVKSYDNPSKAYTQIRVAGTEKSSVARVKMQVETMLAGHIAQCGTQPLVHPYFFQPTSSTFLESFTNTHNVAVIQDRGKTVLRMFGEAESVNAVQEALQAKVKELDDQSKEIILDVQTLAAAMQGGIQVLATVLGKSKVKLDITSNPKRILINGSDQDVGLAQSLLHSHCSDGAKTNAKPNNDDDNAPLCAVCWTPAEDAVTTSCSHSYCSDCIESQASSTSIFPMCCLGDSGKCNTPFALPELRRILTSSAYDDLLESSFTEFIRSHPKDFTYCSTPDCSRFYRISHEASATIFNCDHCLASTCTACHNTAHDGITCTQARSGHDDLDGFSKWKKSNDARDCPGCGTAILKSEGCDHMECQICHAHICWQCMKVFEKGTDVYKHMTKDHQGDWGLGWRHADFE